MPNVLCILTSQSSIAVDGYSLVPHCGASSSCLRAFMEELSQHSIAITYATTHGQECSVFVEDEDSEWYFSNSAAYDHPKSLSECSAADFDGVLIPSSYGGLIDLASSRSVACLFYACSLHAFVLSFSFNYGFQGSWSHPVRSFRQQGAHVLSWNGYWNSLCRGQVKCLPF